MKHHTSVLRATLVLIIVFFLFTMLAGCRLNGPGDSQAQSKAGDTPDCHYRGDLYRYDYTYNDYSGGYLLVQGIPWEDFPSALPLPGGCMDFGMGGGPNPLSDGHSVVIFTSGGDDETIATWYRQQLETAGWEITLFEVSEQYGSTRIQAQNEDWEVDFTIESEEAALGGYDGAMPRDESDFSGAAFWGTINPR